MSWSTTCEPMKPPPPVTATCTAALSRVFTGPLETGRLPWIARVTARAACRPGRLPARERLVHRGDRGEHLFDLRVAHVRVDRQADVPAGDVLGHRQRRPSVLREHRL